jgi:prepilin-type N-terminal cleavage/methylation domain-containing protein
MRDQGLSLIEMLISLAVLMIALSSMFGVFFQGSKYLARIKAELPAYTLARSTLEKYLSWGVLDTLDNSGDGNVTSGEYDSTTNATRFPQVNLTLFTPSASANYTTGIFISNVTNSTGNTIYPNRLKRVTARVTWFDGKNRAFNLTTMKTDY